MRVQFSILIVQVLIFVIKGSFLLNDPLIDEDDHQTTVPDPKFGFWQIIFSDSFSGSDLDSNWIISRGNDNGWGYNEEQYYLSDAVKVQEGMLTITASDVTYNGYPFTSGRITTEGNFNFSQGLIEIKAQLPYGSGVWPQFLLLGDDYSDEGTSEAGEIIIMEYGGDDPTNILGCVNASNVSYCEKGYNFQGFNTSFHVYSVQWTNSEIIWYLDGQQYFAFPMIEAYQTIFSKKFSITIDLAIGGDFPGFANTIFPQTLNVDYVRVYQSIFSEENNDI